ncbi:MAG: hypothetical protein H6710_00520 [Myxococcales bacterium]|nr:hypothetical protein [Myxococcales bacterium]
MEAARGALARGDLAAARAYCDRGEAKVPSGTWRLPFVAVRALAAAREGDPGALAILEAVDPASRAENPSFVTRQQALVAFTLGRMDEAEALLDTLDRAKVDDDDFAETELLRARIRVARGELAEGEAPLWALLGEVPGVDGEPRGGGGGGAQEGARRRASSSPRPGRSPSRPWRRPRRRWDARARARPRRGGARRARGLRRAEPAAPRGAGDLARVAGE